MTRHDQQRRHWSLDLIPPCRAWGENNRGRPSRHRLLCSFAEFEPFIFFALSPLTFECFLEFYVRICPNSNFSTRQAERLVDFWHAIGILEHPQMSFLKRALTCMRSLAVTVSFDFPVCHPGSLEAPGDATPVFRSFHFARKLLSSEC